MLLLFLSFYIFQNHNKNFHKLKKSEFDVQIYELSSKNRWIKYKKDNNLSSQRVNRQIKSVLTFKKSGSLYLNFSFIKKDINSSIEYMLLKNNHQVDKFSLRANIKHQTPLSINRDDTLEIEVTIEKNSAYWGTLNSSFNPSFFNLNTLLIIGLWIIFALFLFYTNYGYLAFLSYAIFCMMIYVEILNFKSLNIETLFAYGFLLFAWTSFVLWIYQLFDKLKRFKISFFIVFSLLALLTLVPTLFMIYNFNFEHSLSKEALYAIFQSNSNEAFEYIEKFIAWIYLLLFIVIYLFMAMVIYRQESLKTKKINNYFLWLLIIVFTLLTYTKVENLHIAKFCIEHFNKYNRELKLFKEIQDKRQLGEIKFEATKKDNAETYIVVIGESLNKNHMGIYGYLRDTTPYLSKMKKQKNLILSHNVYSNHTHTVPVLSLALTQANQYNHKKYFDALSIIEILNKANVNTYWLTNQNIYGEWDNMISVLATSANKLIALNHTIGCNVSTQQYDEALLTPLQEILSQKTSKNRVIFIHLMGSHSVYGSRYPKDKFSIFTKDLDPNVFGKTASINQELNRYDNTIVYNDYVVSSILKELQSLNGVSSFLYLSDHADDIDRDLGHSKDRFTYEMTEIPFISWFNKAYIKKYPQKYHNFLTNKDKLFSNDMLYDTLIGLFDVKTKKYNAKYDLSSKTYNLKPKDALVLHGKRHYTEASNYIYWQKENIKYLKEHNLSDTVIPCNVSTLGATHQVVESGFTHHIKEGKETLSLGDMAFREKLSKHLIRGGKDKILVYYKSDFNP